MAQLSLSSWQIISIRLASKIYAKEKKKKTKGQLSVIEDFFSFDDPGWVSPRKHYKFNILEIKIKFGNPEGFRVYLIPMQPIQNIPFKWNKIWRLQKKMLILACQRNEPKTLSHIF